MVRDLRPSERAAVEVGVGESLEQCRRRGERRLLLLGRELLSLYNTTQNLGAL